MEKMKKELLKNKINIEHIDTENRFFSVSKNGIFGIINANDFEVNLDIFLDSVELNSNICNYDIDYIKSNQIDFSKIEENQIRDLMIDGFELDYLVTLSSSEIDALFCEYN